MFKDSLRGIDNHKINTSVSINIGEKKNSFQLEFILNSICFKKSLIASLNGWMIPHSPVLFGPSRIWESPKIFRSNRVTKATFTNTGMIIKSILII